MAHLTTNHKLQPSPRGGGETNYHGFARARGFTLFEVLVALTVFSFAVGGLVIALESVAEACIEARERALSRLELESRLAYNMVDPPLEGDRTIKTSSGIAITESLTPLTLNNANNQEVVGISRLTITAQNKKTKDSAEILIYRP
ncbi:MAG: prepilin-type N-terminal cleavage/methylation domain-containing protein [Chthoniobacterales bacterium]|nr:prepilin-type N-terminal cleavage/methylation domain-containing protein [Chthoniobacterales bacterium]